MNSITMKLQAEPLILMALCEDITSEDVSTNAIMSEDCQREVELICKQDGVIAGLDVFARTVTLLDEKIWFEFFAKDGDLVHTGQVIAKVIGNIRVLLSGERVALNYLQRMSGIATYTRHVVDLLAGTQITLLDTRKTTPNMRVFEKYAVPWAAARITAIICLTEFYSNTNISMLPAQSKRLSNWLECMHRLYARLK